MPSGFINRVEYTADENGFRIIARKRIKTENQPEAVSSKPITKEPSVSKPSAPTETPTTPTETPTTPTTPTTQTTQTTQTTPTKS